MTTRYDVILAAYHAGSLYTNGQFSPAYRLACRALRCLGPHGHLAHSEEYPSVLNTPGYEDARESYLRQASEFAGDSSGYHECTCCSEIVICDDAESAIVLCDTCIEHECTGHEDDANHPTEEDEDES